MWTTTAEASEKLQRILVAFSMHMPSIGYCQGMNYLAAMLLLVLKADEVNAFWVLVSLLGEVGGMPTLLAEKQSPQARCPANATLYRG